MIRHLRGAVENLGTDRSQGWYNRGGEDIPLGLSTPQADHQSAVDAIFEMLNVQAERVPRLVGHRVVHGGAKYSAPTVIDGQVRKDLADLIAFAPLHQPHSIAVIDFVAARIPDAVQVACFDTAIHRRLPELAQRLPLPRGMWDEGLRRYGFHGLSYEFLLYEYPELGKGRTVIAHLGHGASMTAFFDGIPKHTTMGFTPSGGLMMGTRCGDIDPGVLLYLMKRFESDRSGIERLINRQSGLLGVSGISSDMKTLEALCRMAPKCVAADQAIELFCLIVRQHIGALTATLGGLDRFVFTAGIGEKSAESRSRICSRLQFLGIELDEKRNQEHARTISRSNSRCIVNVLPTDEEWMIAHHALSMESSYAD